ncbi:hypothetical protein ACE2AJ_20425 [Aquihabitans daechungensis]|uniref:hypothetical protein n=1 Tax=Aquihabitans daechungensis TaxID=1052257 RepID=UPI003B9E7BA8
MTEQDEVGASRHALADFGVAFGALVVLVAIAVAVLAWVGVQAWRGRIPAVADDLKRFDEIELHELAGKRALVGTTRSNRLPVVVHRPKEGESSLAVVEADVGTVIDGGPIPVDGWVGDGYPRASERYVGMIHTVCSGKPREGDAGLECGSGGARAATTQLSAFDAEEQTWAILPLRDEPGSLILEDVDGSTAVVRREAGSPDEEPAWAEIDLDRPLELGPFSPRRPPVRPNGLSTSGGHIDGFGWKARSTNGEEDHATWVGTVDGAEETVEISTEPLRHLYGAGRCLVIGSFRTDHLDHLHRLCADP